MLLTVSQPPTGAQLSRQNKTRYGEYLVKHVAMCIQCHTPRDERGELVKGKLLSGAPIPFEAPPFENERWALRAPHIRGLPGYSKSQAIHFLRTGIRPDGTYTNPPMPPFRMRRVEAEAIVLYLKSLD